MLYIPLDCREFSLAPIPLLQRNSSIVAGNFQPGKWQEILNLGGVHRHICAKNHDPQAVPYRATKFSSVTLAATASWGTSKYFHGFPPTVLTGRDEYLLLISFHLITHCLSRNALAITEAELKLIAKAAIIGDSSQPVNGKSKPAANGTPSAL